MGDRWLKSRSGAIEWCYCCIFIALSHMIITCRSFHTSLCYINIEIVIIIMHCIFFLVGPIGSPGSLASENEVARMQIWVAPGHRALCYVEPWVYFLFPLWLIIN